MNIGEFLTTHVQHNVTRDIQFLIDTGKIDESHVSNRWLPLADVYLLSSYPMAYDAFRDTLAFERNMPFAAWLVEQGHSELEHVYKCQFAGEWLCISYEAAEHLIIAGALVIVSESGCFWGRVDPSILLIHDHCIQLAAMGA